MNMLPKVFLRLFLIGLVGCTSNTQDVLLKANNELLFTPLSSDKSGVVFSNRIKETIQFNFINYPYIYNGGGVAAGDINNDGLIDLYFTSNQNSNALYLNKGNLQFLDITKKASVSDAEGWTTGVSMIDINADGLLDIYVCKSGSLNNSKLRQNKLYVNQGDNTFKEEAEKYKLNDAAFSTQAYFFDFDKDGDLDMYLVNHRPDFENNAQSIPRSKVQMDARFSDQLYRNDGGVFSNITRLAGFLNFTWGLSASIADFNSDGWPDIYVCNDFLEADNFYINNGDGTFTDKLQDYLGHIPLNSMGSDVADYNNDGLYDLMVVEMSPSDHIRSKNNMPSMSNENFEKIIGTGNYYQYMSNALQLNTGNGRMSEIAQLATVAKTDWSWAPLFADFDNDGFKDLFVSNGIFLDLSNNDFRNKFKSKIKKKELLSLDEAIAMVPSNKLSNYIFKNNADLTFSDNTKKWGLNTATFSNGATYADLDNDGDLELIINNLEEEASIYKNNAEHNYLKIKLKGLYPNGFGVGAEIKLYEGKSLKLFQQYGNRGFQSSIPNVINIGLNNTTLVDSIKVFWPSGTVSSLYKVKANQTLIVKESKSLQTDVSNSKVTSLFTKAELSKYGIDFNHKERSHDDFVQQVLLPHKLSQNGPFISIGDINNDNLDDFYIGGAAGQSGELYVQQKNGKFNKIIKPFNIDKDFEDQRSIFLDFDNDGDADLYVVSGSSEFEEGSHFLQDRLYENVGDMKFEKTNNVLPELLLNGQSITAGDYDNDGDIDIFIGGRQVTHKYPYSPNSYFLKNIDGEFQIDHQVLGTNNLLGMITDALFLDIDNDDDLDLITVGEWSKIQFYENTHEKFRLLDLPSLNKTIGMWFSIGATDIDNDGDIDFFFGNLGLNSKYTINQNSEFHIFCDDFDNSGTYDIVLSKKYEGELVPVRGKECSSQQMPSIKTKYPTYNEFANAELSEIIGKDLLDSALHIKMDLLESVFVENLGGNNYKLQKLPSLLQKAPIMAFEFADIENDGFKEVITVGDFYPTEVETIRYDAGEAVIIKYVNQEFISMDTAISGLASFKDMRDVKLINIGFTHKKMILISNNDDTIELYELN